MRILDNNTFVELLNKNVYISEYDEKCLVELCDNYDILQAIVGGFDDAKRNQGIQRFREKEIPVQPLSEIAKLPKNAVLIITSDYYEEVYERIIKYRDDLPIYFFPNSETEMELAYRSKLEMRPLQDIIVFRSGPHPSAYVRGMDFSDNSRALFEYMLQVGLNKKYKLVWQVKNPAEFSNKYRNVHNVEFQGFEWGMSKDVEQQKKYYETLFLAKFIFFTDAYGFARNCRNNQIRVQLWHGCGFKTRVNFVPCEHRYEYNIVISSLYQKIHVDIYGLRNDQVLVTGYPKQDWLFHPVPKKILASLGIPESKKYIFWLPTFRGATDKLKSLNENTLLSENGMPIISDENKMKVLNKVLCDYDVVMVIKLHPFQRKECIKIPQMSNITLVDNEQLVDYDIQINQLLGRADALISDYSSAAVDYLTLDRPIAFTLDDVQEYENSRGFVFDNIREWLPGKEIYTEQDFFAFVKEIGMEEDCSAAKRHNIRKLMHGFNDDKSSCRVLDALGIN